MMYKERFEAIELEACELVMIRELAVNYRKKSWSRDFWQKPIIS